MSDTTSNERNKIAMREKNSNNLNTSGREGVRVCSPSQAGYVTKTTNKPGKHPYDNRK
jgi:hypothetical protein